MSKSHALAIAAITIGLVVPSYSRPASAAPVNGASAIEHAAPSSLETVRWRGGVVARGVGPGGGWHGGGWHGGGWRGGGWRGGGWHGGGWGYYGGGFAAGAILGGLLAAPYYYGGPVYSEYWPSGGDAIGYCIRRFRSYDVRSRTYLGYDGYRHPCP